MYDFHQFPSFGVGEGTICIAHQWSHNDSQRSSSWYWEMGQKEQTALMVCWYLTLRAITGLQVGKQIAGCGGLKRCRSDLLRSGLTALAVTPQVPDARLLPGCSQPVLSMVGVLVQPHSCLMRDFSRRWLAWGLPHWPDQSFLRMAPHAPNHPSSPFSFQRCQMYIQVWGSLYHASSLYPSQAFPLIKLLYI